MQNGIHRSDLIKDKHFWPSSLPSGFSCQRSEARFSHSIAAQPWLRFLRKLLTCEKQTWKSTEQSHEDGRGNTAGRSNVIEIGIVISSRTQREKTLRWKDTRSWRKKKQGPENSRSPTLRVNLLQQITHCVPSPLGSPLPGKQGLSGCLPGGGEHTRPSLTC